MTEWHSEFKNFELVGDLDVDAGSIWVGDGCYVLKDPNEARPEDLGNDWGDICDKFFNRSGYHAREQEWFARGNQKFSDWTNVWVAAKNGEIPELPDRDVWEAQWEKDHPFQPKAVDTGVAAFGHTVDGTGMGLMINTFYGDGIYPVYIEYKDGRPRRVLIDFDPGPEENENVEEN